MCFNFAYLFFVCLLAIALVIIGLSIVPRICVSVVEDLNVCVVLHSVSLNLKSGYS